MILSEKYMKAYYLAAWLTVVYNRLIEEAGESDLFYSQLLVFHKVHTVVVAARMEANRILREETQ